MLKTAGIVLSCFFMLACGLCAIYAAYWPAYRPGPERVVEYKDFVAILLTAVTVMVALVAFIVALLTIFGYEAIKKLMVDHAENAAKSHVDARMPRIVQEVLAFSKSGGATADETTLEPKMKDQADAIARAYADEPREARK